MRTFDCPVEILEALNNFDIPVIPEDTQFWMIRTQQGYFYDEVIARKFVAIAWNNIDESTDLSDDNIEHLKDEVMVEFPKIRRPSVVISKCSHFIHDVKKGDILVIPSKGSKRITFALAGEYYEESAKTLEIEKTIISKIDNQEVDITDVSCPYKKDAKLLYCVQSAAILWIFLYTEQSPIGTGSVILLPKHIRF